MLGAEGKAVSTQTELHGGTLNTFAISWFIYPNET